MIKKPLISIIITYFDKLEYIKKTLESVLAQSYKNYELIFIYDDNNLNDFKFIKPLLIKFKKKKVILNKKNIGVSQSRNKALNLSKGDYIAFIDSDDIWKKTKLIKQLKFMRKNLSDFSFTSYDVINYQNRIIKKRVVNLDPSYKTLQKKKYYWT